MCFVIIIVVVVVVVVIVVGVVVVGIVVVAAGVVGGGAVCRFAHRRGISLSSTVHPCLLTKRGY